MIILLNLLLLVTPLFAQEKMSKTTDMGITFYQNNMTLLTDNSFPLEPPETISESVDTNSFSDEEFEDSMINQVEIISLSVGTVSDTDTVPNNSTPMPKFSTNYQAIEEFFHFIRIGDVDSVRKLLNEGMDPNIKKLPDLTNGVSALMCSIANRRVLVTHLLLTNKADPNLSLNKLTISNITPLMLAAQQGPIESVEHLLEYGADITAKTRGSITGNTALMVAIQAKKFNTVELLLKKGADINNTSDRGITPLMLAAQTGDINIVNLLISNPKIDIHAMDSKGKNALVYGYISGNIELLQLFTKLEMTTDLSSEEIKAIVKKHL